MSNDSWQQVEENVRKIAEVKWSGNAVPETVAGVRCDAVLKYKADYWVLIEVSKQSTLAKAREDFIKLTTMKTALFAQGIYAECYFITSGEHTSLIESGKQSNVHVHTLRTFANLFLGSSQYLHERQKQPFGSAVNPDSGEKDETPYIPTYYVDDNGDKYTIERICECLLRGTRIVLVGEFGTGKSRCLMEVFNKLNNNMQLFPAVSINLRDNWGYKRLGHIIKNHLDLLGLGAFSDQLIRSIHNGNHVLLLDGIDEIGSQSWSADPNRLTEIRKKSLEGVRDIVSSCHSSGILFTGREHYFSSDEEMFECLGLARKNTLKIRCPDEFSDEEIAMYIGKNTNLASIPEWVPRKPLICQLLTKLEPSEVKRLEEAAHGEVEFFETIFDAICERETRIHPSIYKNVLKSILIYLAHHTRCLCDTNECISTSDINTAFYNVTGNPPIDEAAVLLQRLPYLGRIGSGGADRIFIDSYARSGLRGLSLSEILLNRNRKVATEKWEQTVGGFGMKIVSSKVTPNEDINKFIRYCSNHGNSQIACDYIQLCLSYSNETVDFKNLSVTDGIIDELSFVNVLVKNLKMSSVYVKEMEIDNVNFVSVDISDCVFDCVSGIGSENSLPNVFHKCSYEKFKTALTVSRISNLKISNGQKTLLAIIKKLFFQPGSGRQEGALLRGAEDYWDERKAEEILHYMLRNDIIIKSKGDHGVLYIPKRRQMVRMRKILELQNNSEDELWSMSGQSRKPSHN